MPPDSYDDALQGNDRALEGRHLVLMERTDRGPGGDDAMARLAEALSGAIFNPVDESTGVFEIAVEAPDRAAALQRVVDAVAAAGADDHVLVAENPHSQPEGP
jgi:hypothetical protein